MQTSCVHTERPGGILPGCRNAFREPFIICSRCGLARCPECGTENQTPTRTWRVLDEPTQAGRFTERSVGIFQCARCGAVFPQVVGRRRLAIIDADEYLKMRKELEDLRAENTKLRDDADLGHLQTSVDALEKEVSALQSEKKELEARLAQGNGSLDQVP